MLMNIARGMKSLTFVSLLGALVIIGVALSFSTKVIAGVDKFDVCHVTNVPEQGDGIVISIASPGWPAHEKHGDKKLGELGVMFDMGRVRCHVSTEPVAPVAVDDEVTTTEGTTVTIDVLANDIYDDLGYVSIIVFPQYGSLSIVGEGIFEYSPFLDHPGTDSFIYQICDTDGSLCDTATVTITVAPVTPQPESTLSPRLFILGSEIIDNKLHIYVHGLDAAGNTISLADFQTISVVTVDGTVRLNNGADANGGGVTVQLIPDGSPISLGLLTDYSVSIPQTSLESISDIYEAVLNSLPSGFEAQVLNFSNLTNVRQDWTTNQQTLLAAVQFDQDIFRANTALYDGIGNSLYREAPGLGLSDRCRPARMLLTYTDGVDNASFLYNKNDLLDEIDSSRTVAIMLGTVNSNKAELEEFAGTRGAFVYAFDVDDFTQDVLEWAESLEHIVEFVIDAGTYNQDPPGAVQIEVATIGASIEAPYDLDCIAVP